MRRLRSLALSANVGQIMHVFCKVVTSYRHMAVTPVKGLSAPHYSVHILIQVHAFMAITVKKNRLAEYGTRLQN